MNIGLLMTFNEADVIAEMLEAATPHVDAIFALDGSTDGTDEIIRAHPKLERLFKDAEVVTSGPTRDYHRQALLDAARERFGHGHWYTLLHGDEFLHDDPRVIIERAERERATFVNWASMQFFLHTSDARRNLEGIQSVQERVRWYSPFWVEVRQFKDNPRARFGPHGRVQPLHVGWKPFSKMPILKHYPYRSVAQMQAKGLEPGFSGGHADPQVFRETAQPMYRVARRFHGDFGAFELARQGSLLGMVLRQRGLLRRSG